MINSTITFTYVPLVLCESAQTLSPVFFFFKYFAVCVWDVSGVSDSGWLHDNLKWRSPVARIKCWRFTFLQITGMFTRVYVAFTMSTFLHFLGGGAFLWQEWQETGSERGGDTKQRAPGRTWTTGCCSGDKAHEHGKPAVPTELMGAPILTILQYVSYHVHITSIWTDLHVRKWGWQLRGRWWLSIERSFVAVKPLDTFN